MARVDVTLTGPGGGAFVWPGASNTGVPAGTTLTTSGGLNVTTNGAVIQNLDVTSGQILVNASNVTIKNCKIHGSGVQCGVWVQSGNAVIQDCEIYGSGYENALGFDNFTALRCNIHGTAGDGMKLGSNVTVRNCWVHDLAPPAGAHSDGMQQQFGLVNLIVEDSFIDMRNFDANGATQLSPDQGPNSAGPCLFNHNKMAGGGYTFRLGLGNNGQYRNDGWTVTNNRFIRGAYTWGPVLLDAGVNPVWSGNVYDDNEQVISI